MHSWDWWKVEGQQRGAPAVVRTRVLLGTAPIGVQYLRWAPLKVRIIPRSQEGVKWTSTPPFNFNNEIVGKMPEVFVTDTVLREARKRTWS